MLLEKVVDATQQSDEPGTAPEASSPVDPLDSPVKRPPIHVSGCDEGSVATRIEAAG